MFFDKRSSRSRLAIVATIQVVFLLLKQDEVEGFPGRPCFNNTDCDSPSRCVGGFCCLYEMGFSCQACANNTGECLINDCLNCARFQGERCVYKRDDDHGCCKAEVDAVNCFTYCNFTGDCNPLFAEGDECEIDEQCESKICLGDRAGFDESYCCKADTGITCSACGINTGECIAENFLVYLMGVMAVLLFLTGIACFVSARNGYIDEVRNGGGGIDGYGRGVRVLSPFDDEQGLGEEEFQTGEDDDGEDVVQAQKLSTAGEEEVEGKEEDGGTLIAEIVTGNTREREPTL